MSEPTDSNLPQDAAFSPGRERIPKKTQSSAFPDPIPTSSAFDDDGITLPPGVVLPPSVTPQVLAGKPKRMLLELPRESMIQALAEFDMAVKEKGSEIRSLSAYFVGVIKRYKMIQQGGKPGQLSDRVLARLERLVNSGYCTQSEIDGQLKSKLTMLSEEDALSAIDEMNLIERSEIRQFASYFMGIMNRYAKTRHANAGNNINNNFSNNRDKQRRKDNNQDYRERRMVDTNGKYSHYGRGNEDNGISNKNGKDSNRGSELDSSRSRRRSSRDRYDRHDRHRRRRSRSYSSSSSRSRSRSRERRRRRRSRSDSRDRDDYRSRKSHRDRDSRKNQRLSPSENLSRSMFPPPSGQSMAFPPPPPPPPRPATMSAPPSMTHLAPGRVHHPTMQQVASSTTLGHSATSNFQRTNDQQLQQLFQLPQPPNPTQQNQQITLPANLSQQQIQALQAILQQGPSMQQPAAQATMSRWSSQATGQGQTQPWQHPTQVARTTWPTSNQVQNQPPPLDIMGLADKAAQALSGQLSSHPPVSINPNSMFPSHPSPRIITEKDLPQLVQYAVQNLRVSGHINESTLDPFVCDMLKKIPEQNALLALETFSVCDVSKMRNKVAYLSGILKKEIVKLGLQ
ncbi:hypothetical protein HJC23_010944 [Cyclotella cryptica]|uniref:Heterogeneous nuclear ribonucleoprotein Q acidic domain-containing protein n=1 Tax=Cyclotella cryptica TaxID=29204 RepID=A0ABD3Q8X7_9STRA|eukprot:CCRYP_007606-RA/>CCRYP_007606-RA protein AED:0.28 eAED:0.28 QI:591/1/1/1/0.8/0.66/6/2075/624